MSGVIRTHLSPTEESITLGARRPSAISAVPTALPSPIAEPLSMAAIAMDAIAPAMLASKVDLEDIEAKRLADIRQAAHDEGFKVGRDEGLAVGEFEWQDKLKRLVDVVETLQGERESILAAMEDDVVALVFEAMVRILGERPVTRLIVEQAVRELYASGDYHDPITVRVSSEDYELLVAEPLVVDLEDRRSAIRLIEDARLKLGGCIVETPRGALDARIETQFERLRSALLDARATKISAA